MICNSEKHGRRVYIELQIEIKLLDVDCFEFNGINYDNIYMDSTFLRCLQFNKPTTK
jgi:hypothetical protein